MTAQPETHTLNLSDVTLRYDIRGDLQDAGPDNPPLLLIGSPMDAAGFVSLAGHFADRIVVTYDPRGTGRSTLTGSAAADAAKGVAEWSPDDHAEDVRRVIEALGTGPVDLFASSGGAVNALALVARHPALLRTAVAHEPPLARAVPDSAQALATVEDIHATYRREGMGPAMAKFLTLIVLRGPLPDTYADQPAPDPAGFGLPTEDDGTRDDPLLGQNMLGCCGYAPDFAALSAAPTRLVIAVGEESEGELAARAGAAVAERLGLAPAVFPSHHGGFLGGEYGQQGEPEAFAARLREVLAGN
ncbi:alpha/beta fold hydrolase [Streptomyces sp. NPDC048172]|uniref:alpha/beta fold hydrolase n=1 Tax=Streptomyces sp. NPDC048172 TaxID=3365505 RepID=UPI0037140CD9